MKPLLACAAALAVALTIGLSAPAAGAHSFVPAATGHQLVAPIAPIAPLAPAKKTPKPSASPTVTPSPSPSIRPRSEAEIEGERWVQIAWLGGGGLLGCVLVFFAIGALVRRKGRRR